MPKHTVGLRRLSWLASFAWMGVIFCFSAQDAQESASLSGTFMTFLLRLLHVQSPETILADSALYATVDFILRKGAHFTIYMVLGFLLCTAISLYPHALRIQKIALPLSLGILYACTDELHQYFVPGRACQIRDVCIDAAGVLTGLALSMGIGWLLRRSRQRKAEKAGLSAD